MAGSYECRGAVKWNLSESYLCHATAIRFLFIFFRIRVDSMGAPKFSRSVTSYYKVQQFIFMLMPCGGQLRHDQIHASAMHLTSPTYVLLVLCGCSNPICWINPSVMPSTDERCKASPKRSVRDQKAWRKLGLGGPSASSKECLMISECNQMRKR